MVLSGMILGMIILNFRGMKLVETFFVSFFMKCFSQTSFATVILTVLNMVKY